jgi:hypothetical protein
MVVDLWPFVSDVQNKEQSFVTKEWYHGTNWAMSLRIASRCRHR